MTVDARFAQYGNPLPDLAAPHPGQVEGARGRLGRLLWQLRGRTGVQVDRLRRLAGRLDFLTLAELRELEGLVGAFSAPVRPRRRPRPGWRSLGGRQQHRRRP